MQDKSPLGRRTLLGGAATAAVAATLAARHAGPAPQPTPSADAATPAAPQPGQAGYQLTEHVKRYYASARI